MPRAQRRLSNNCRSLKKLKWKTPSFTQFSMCVMSSTNALASILLSSNLAHDSCLFCLLKERWRFLIAVKHSEWYFKFNTSRSQPPSILVSKTTSCKSTAICLTLSLASVVLNFRSIPFSSWQNKQASVITDSRRWRFSTSGLLSLEPSRSRLVIARCTFWLLNFTWHDLCQKRYRQSVQLSKSANVIHKWLVCLWMGLRSWHVQWTLKSLSALLLTDYTHFPVHGVYEITLYGTLHIVSIQTNETNWHRVCRPASILGTITRSVYVHTMCPSFRVPLFLHSILAVMRVSII